MLSPYQQILKKQQTDAERDAFLLKKTLELLSLHETMLKKISEIKDIKVAPSTIPGPRGFKGDPGKTFSKQEVVDMLLPYIPRAESGKTPTKDELKDIISDLMPKVDVEHIAKLAAAIAKQKLPIQPKIDIEELLKGRKFNMSDIEGLTEAIKMAQQHSRPYLHGGGVPSLTAGTGITLTPKNDGGFIVSASGGGTWYQDEVLTRTDGTNYTLAHAPTAVVFLFLNGQPQMGGGVQYTRTGTGIVMVDATLSTDILTAAYS